MIMKKFVCLLYVWGVHTSVSVCASVFSLSLHLINICRSAFSPSLDAPPRKTIRQHFFQRNGATASSAIFFILIKKHNWNCAASHIISHVCPCASVSLSLVHSRCTKYSRRIPFVDDNDVHIFQLFHIRIKSRHQYTATTCHLFLRIFSLSAGSDSPGSGWVRKFFYSIWAGVAIGRESEKKILVDSLVHA